MEVNHEIHYQNQTKIFPNRGSGVNLAAAAGGGLRRRGNSATAGHVPTNRGGHANNGTRFRRTHSDAQARGDAGCRRTRTA
jgi:hypothetical protein